MSILYNQNVRLLQSALLTLHSSARTLSRAMEPKPLVFCGPSGSGKSTLLRRLIDDYPDRLGFSVSHTTRQPRSGEQDGVHYHFVDAAEMQRQIASGKFIEFATFSGNMYGTSKMAIETVHAKGKVCVLDIDMQGVQQVKNSNLSFWYIFVKPPSLESLEQRLRLRKTETEESLAKRLDAALKEIEYGETAGNFDIVIVNDDLDQAYTQLKEFVETRVFNATNSRDGN